MPSRLPPSPFLRLSPQGLPWGAILSHPARPVHLVPDCPGGLLPTGSPSTRAPPARGCRTARTRRHSAEQQKTQPRIPRVRRISFRMSGLSTVMTSDIPDFHQDRTIGYMRRRARDASASSAAYYTRRGSGLGLSLASSCLRKGAHDGDRSHWGRQCRRHARATLGVGGASCASFRLRRRLSALFAA
jgi:hypothetical protein